MGMPTEMGEDMSDSGAARPGKLKRAKARGECLGDLRAQYHRRNVMRQVRRAVASAREKGTWRRLREKTQVHKPSPQQTREAKQTQAVHLWGEQIKEAVHGLIQEKEELAEREARKAAAVDELRAEKEACTQMFPMWNKSPLLSLSPALVSPRAGAL